MGLTLVLVLTITLGEEALNAGSAFLALRGATGGSSVSSSALAAGTRGYCLIGVLGDWISSRSAGWSGLRGILGAAGAAARFGARRRGVAGAAGIGRLVVGILSFCYGQL